MTRREQVTIVDAVNAFDTQVINTDTTTSGDIMDVSDCNAATFLIQAGTITLGTLAVVIQEGDDSGLSDAATVGSGYLFYPSGETAASFAASDDNLVKRVGVITDKRYLRLQLTSAASANLTVGAILLKGEANINPTTQT
ncbi:MAG: hypothetical protein HOG49_02445 [Candidatus Scalindua sp.]|jgi:hypothetical protein|nr:hypothetical protein [Candidatus Scalindua sp.]